MDLRCFEPPGSNYERLFFKCQVNVLTFPVAPVGLPIISLLLQRQKAHTAKYTQMHPVL